MNGWSNHEYETVGWGKKFSLCETGNKVNEGNSCFL